VEDFSLRTIAGGASICFRWAEHRSRPFSAWGYSGGIRRCQAGLGYLILQMNFNLDVPGMFAVLVVLGLMGVGFNMAAQYLRRKIVFWQPEGITEAAN
jgi:hypothetical protein